MNELNRRHLLMASLLAVAPVSYAQSWPAKPVTLVVPFTPGSNSDLLARMLTVELTKQLGQPFVVLNKPGASGIIGSDAVAKAPPDGYTLLLSSGATHSAGPWLQKKFPYDVIKDFSSVAQIHAGPWVLVVNSSVPIKNFQEFILYARSNSLSYGYGAATTQVVSSVFSSQAGLNAMAVPYKGPSLAMNDLLGGQVQFAFEALSVAEPHIKGGKLRAIAVTSIRRMALMPNVPTLAELGFEKFDMVGWAGISAPAGTPVNVLDRLHDAVGKILAERIISTAIEGMGLTPAVGLSRAGFEQYVDSQYHSWGQFIRQAGIKPE